MLHIVRGLPGTGKSTFAKSSVFGGMLVIERDQFWIGHDGSYNYDDTKYDECKQYVKDMLMTAMQHKVNCVVASCLIKNESVLELIEIAKTFDCAYTVWTMVPNQYIADTHNVPAEAKAAMQKVWADKIILPNGEEVKQTLVQAVPTGKYIFNVDGNIVSSN